MSGEPHLPPLVPSPLRATPGGGTVRIPRHLTVAGPDEGLAALRPFLRVLEDAGSAVSVTRGRAGFLTVALRGAGECPAGRRSATPEDPLGVGDESYELEVTGEGVTLTGTLAGLRHGAATLLGLLPPEVLRPGSGAEAVLPIVSMSDRPAHPWRGLLVDVARHFMPISWLRTLVDIAAFHKLNVLHLHLTDDQGWRMPVEAFPRLATHASRRTETLVGPAPGNTFDGRAHGGIYTAGELRDLDAYASSRGVILVPEIDLPGHMAAAISAYPEWGPGEKVDVWTTWGISPTIMTPSRQTIDALATILDEVMDVFDTPVIHLGGDEVPTTQWEADPRVAELMAEEGIPSVREVQGWIMARLIDHVERRGRSVVCWDDALRGGVATTVAVQAWTSPEAVRRAMDAGYRVVASPQQHYYLGFSSALGSNEPLGYGVGKDIATPLETVGEYLLPDGLLGVEATLWAEYIKTPAKASYQLLPRLVPVAERAWSGNRVTGEELADATRAQVRRYEYLGWDHRPLDGPGPRWSRVWNEDDHDR